ncbi:hypothetical protein SUGI_0394790 [Cryptomeria japonica]|uniref:uncharacterized protein LOC131047311 isoform X2 n=1 Tax=Cryptomeria japonica TaxID=3369 RepID=UPI002408A0DB|nr:uncharacterized protein LOC131047311 isoform X2 [Cryptomeria japonica]GLJ21436.1 hypothetical protein SUGI_0394790 [Cryptomeria japonica]
METLKSKKRVCKKRKILGPEGTPNRGMAERQLWVCACVVAGLCVSYANADSLCRSTCGAEEVDYPWAIDDGCGAPQLRNMMSCDQTDAELDLMFHTISGSYKVQSMDYRKQQLTVFDPNMSTCNTLQPQPSKEFKMEKVQSVVISPSPDTLFILLNCSIDSPVLHRYSSLCTNFSSTSCQQLYSCPAFNIFVMNGTTPPPCCATDYTTLNLLSLEVLDCSHYTTIYNADSLNTNNALDWPYGIHLSYSLPDSICPECQRSGGTCGFSTDTERPLCLCNGGMNSTRDCGGLKNVGMDNSSQSSGSSSAANSIKAANVQLLSLFLMIAGISSLRVMDCFSNSV